MIALVAVVLVLVLGGLGDNPANQIGLAAEWQVGSQQMGLGEMETLQVRLSVENRTAEPVFIQPTTEDLFAARAGSERGGNEGPRTPRTRPSFLERLAEQGMKEAVQEMEEGRPKKAFRLQVAFGREKAWAPLSPDNWDQERGGDPDRLPEVEFDMVMGPGWTIPAKKALRLVLRVAARPKGQAGGYGPAFGPLASGEIPDAVRIRAVRAPNNARLPELTVSVPGNIRASWGKKS